MTTDITIPPERVVARALRDHFGEAIDLLRFEAPLDTLDASEWAVLVLLILGWAHDRERASQAELAARSGFAVRTVRRSLVTLEQLELTSGNRSRELRLGPRLEPLLRVFAATWDPRLWTRRVLEADKRTHLGPTPDNRTEDGAPKADNGAHGIRGPEDNETQRPVVTVGGADSRAHAPMDIRSCLAPESDNRTYPRDPSAGLIKNIKKEDLTSSSLEGGPIRPVEQGVVDAATSRRLALKALAALHQRANPGIPLPRACDAANVRLVEACAAKGTWNASELEQTNLDAIAGAFDRSTSGAPTPMFIWGQLHFFLKNARIGRALRLKPKPVLRPRAAGPEEAPASLEWLAEHLRGVNERLSGIPDPSKPKLPTRFVIDAD
jgi:hypothetical protein